MLAAIGCYSGQEVEVDWFHNYDLNILYCVSGSPHPPTLSTFFDGLYSD